MSIARPTGPGKQFVSKEHDGKAQKPGAQTNDQLLRGSSPHGVKGLTDQLKQSTKINPEQGIQANKAQGGQSKQTVASDPKGNFSGQSKNNDQPTRPPIQNNAGPSDALEKGDSDRNPAKSQLVSRFQNEGDLNLQLGRVDPNEKVNSQDESSPFKTQISEIGNPSDVGSNIEDSPGLRESQIRSGANRYETIRPSGLKPPELKFTHMRVTSEGSSQGDRDPQQLHLNLNADDKRSMRSHLNKSQISMDSPLREINKSQGQSPLFSRQGSRHGSRALFINKEEMNELSRVSSPGGGGATSRSRVSQGFAEETDPHAVEWVHNMEKMIKRSSRTPSEAGSNVGTPRIGRGHERVKSGFAITVTNEADSYSKQGFTPRGKIQSGAQTPMGNEASLEELLKGRIKQNQEKAKTSFAEEARRLEQIRQKKAEKALKEGLFDDSPIEEQYEEFAVQQQKQDPSQSENVAFEGRGHHHRENALKAGADDFRGQQNGNSAGSLKSSGMRTAKGLLTHHEIPEVEERVHEDEQEMMLEGNPVAKALETKFTRSEAKERTKRNAAEHPEEAGNETLPSGQVDPNNLTFGKKGAQAGDLRALLQKQQGDMAAADKTGGSKTDIQENSSSNLKSEAGGTASKQSVADSSGKKISKKSGKSSKEQGGKANEEARQEIQEDEMEFIEGGGSASNQIETNFEGRSSKERKLKAGQSSSQQGQASSTKNKRELSAKAGGLKNEGDMVNQDGNAESVEGKPKSSEKKKSKKQGPQSQGESSESKNTLQIVSDSQEIKISADGKAASGSKQGQNAKKGTKGKKAVPGLKLEQSESQSADKNITKNSTSGTERISSMKTTENEGEGVRKPNQKGSENMLARKGSSGGGIDLKGLQKLGAHNLQSPKGRLNSDPNVAGINSKNEIDSKTPLDEYWSIQQANAFKSPVSQKTKGKAKKLLNSAGSAQQRSNSSGQINVFNANRIYQARLEGKNAAQLTGLENSPDSEARISHMDDDQAAKFYSDRRKVIMKNVSQTTKKKVSAQPHAFAIDPEELKERMAAKRQNFTEADLIEGTNKGGTPPKRGTQGSGSKSSGVKGKSALTERGKAESASTKTPRGKNLIDRVKEKQQQIMQQIDNIENYLKDTEPDDPRGTTKGKKSKSVFDGNLKLSVLNDSSLASGSKSRDKQTQTEPIFLDELIGHARGSSATDSAMKSSAKKGVETARTRDTKKTQTEERVLREDNYGYGNGKMANSREGPRRGTKKNVSVSEFTTLSKNLSPKGSNQVEGTGKDKDANMYEQEGVKASRLRKNKSKESEIPSFSKYKSKRNKAEEKAEEKVEIEEEQIMRGSRGKSPQRNEMRKSPLKESPSLTKSPLGKEGYSPVNQRARDYEQAAELLKQFNKNGKGAIPELSAQDIEDIAKKLLESRGFFAAHPKTAAVTTTKVSDKGKGQTPITKENLKSSGVLSPQKGAGPAGPTVKNQKTRELAAFEERNKEFIQRKREQMAESEEKNEQNKPSRSRSPREFDNFYKRNTAWSKKVEIDKAEREKKYYENIKPRASSPSTHQPATNRSISPRARIENSLPSVRQYMNLIHQNASSDSLSQSNHRFGLSSRVLHPETQTTLGNRGVFSPIEIDQLLREHGLNQFATTTREKPLNYHRPQSPTGLQTQPNRMEIPRNLHSIYRIEVSSPETRTQQYGVIDTANAKAAQEQPISGLQGGGAPITQESRRRISDFNISFEVNRQIQFQDNLKRSRDLTDEWDRLENIRPHLNITKELSPQERSFEKSRTPSPSGDRSLDLNELLNSDYVKKNLGSIHIEDAHYIIPHAHHEGSRHSRKTSQFSEKKDGVGKSITSEMDRAANGQPEGDEANIKALKESMNS